MLKVSHKLCPQAKCCRNLWMFRLSLRGLPWPMARKASSVAFGKWDPRGVQGSRAGAFLRQALYGERDPEKRALEVPRRRRHAMIEEAVTEHPQMPLTRLCAHAPVRPGE
jgi:hypothetical protein